MARKGFCLLVCFLAGILIILLAFSADPGIAVFSNQSNLSKKSL